MANPTKSGLYLTTFKALMVGTAVTGGPFDLTATTIKVGLVTSAATDGSDPLNFSAADSSWTTTNECSGTGWASGGIALSAAASGGTSCVPVCQESGTAGTLVWALTNNISVASTTLTAAYGSLFHYPAITAPTTLADAMIVYVNFGGSYSTNNGTFGITFTSDNTKYDIFTIDLTLA